MPFSFFVAVAARRFIQEAIFEYGFTRREAIAQLRALYAEGIDVAHRELLANYCNY